MVVFVSVNRNSSDLRFDYFDAFLIATSPIRGLLS